MGRDLLVAVHHALDIACDEVDFEVDPRAGRQALQRGDFQGMRNQVDPEIRRFHPIHGKAHAVDGDRALARDVLRQLARRPDHEFPAFTVLPEADDLADTVDVPSHQMAAEPVRQTQRFLEVDLAGRVQPDGARQRFAGNVELQCAAVDGHDGETDAAAGDTVADRDICRAERGGVHGKAKAFVERCELRDAADRGNDSGKHDGFERKTAGQAAL